MAAAPQHGVDPRACMEGLVIKHQVGVALIKKR